MAPAAGPYLFPRASSAGNENPGFDVQNIHPRRRIAERQAPFGSKTRKAGKLQLLWLLHWVLWPSYIIAKRGGHP
jgi:hypothetical protein